MFGAEELVVEFAHLKLGIAEGVLEFAAGRRGGGTAAVDFGAGTEFLFEFFAKAGGLNSEFVKNRRSDAVALLE